MTLLIFGLILFIGIHLIPSFPRLREGIINTLSNSAYMGIFSALSLGSIAMVVLGLKQAPFEALYNPPGWGRHLNMLLMFLALYLFASNTAGSAPSSAKVFTAFPLSWGLMLWAIGHLFANGDLAHVLLFGSFLFYAVISIIMGKARGVKPIATKRPPLAQELVFISILVFVYMGLFWAHKYFTGMPLV